MLSPLKKRFHRLKIQITQRYLKDYSLTRIPTNAKPNSHEFIRANSIKIRVNLCREDFFRILTQIVFLYSVLCALYCVCYAQSQEYIRVAVLRDVSSLRIKIHGSYEVVDLAQNKVLYEAKDLKTTATTYKDGILLGKIQSQSDKLLIKTSTAELLLINGRRFRGDVVLIRQKNSHLCVINYIGLEDYIKGVMYHEVSHYWPMEALKAQAIASRAYALSQKEEKASFDYDVTSDIYSQVYGGRISERYRTNMAVDETRGMILTYQDKIFPAYYHATCGGYTEDASLLWNIDIPPLKGVACAFCKDSPHFRWHYVLSLDEIQKKLTESRKLIGKIKDIVILSLDKSGRVVELKILTDNKDFNIAAKDFRNIIGPNIIRSTNLGLKIIDGDAVFEGFGWGHGVGLCQWGAYFMAKQGYTVEQILKYYYPGSELKRF